MWTWRARAVRCTKEGAELVLLGQGAANDLHQPKPPSWPMEAPGTNHLGCCGGPRHGPNSRSALQRSSAPRPRLTTRVPARPAPTVLMSGRPGSDSGSLALGSGRIQRQSIEVCKAAFSGLVRHASPMKKKLLPRTVCTAALLFAGRALEAPPQRVVIP